MCTYAYKCKDYEKEPCDIINEMCEEKPTCFEENPLKAQIESVAEVPCSALLSTLSEILDICENTEELSGKYNSEEAMNCDAALTEIMDRCKEALKKDK